MPIGDVGKIRIGDPDLSGRILEHQHADRPIKTGIGVGRQKLNAKRRVAEHQQDWQAT